MFSENEKPLNPLPTAQCHDSCVRHCRPWHVVLHSASRQQQLVFLFFFIYVLPHFFQSWNAV